MKADHFDVLDTDTDASMGRWCDTCLLRRHADCKPAGCRADRDRAHRRPT